MGRRFLEGPTRLLIPDQPSRPAAHVRRRAVLHGIPLVFHFSCILQLRAVRPLPKEEPPAPHFQRPQKKVCVPKIGLKFPALLISRFAGGKLFLMWGWPGPPTSPPPPPGGSLSDSPRAVDDRALSPDAPTCTCSEPSWIEPLDDPNETVASIRRLDVFRSRPSPFLSGHLLWVAATAGGLNVGPDPNASALASALVR